MNIRGMSGKLKHMWHSGRSAESEVVDDVLGPLVRLGEEHFARVLGVDRSAQVGEKAMRLRQVLAVGALALVEVWHGVEPEAVHAQVEPEPAHVDDLGAHLAGCRS